MDKLKDTRLMGPGLAAVFVLMITAMSYPLIFKITTNIPGFFATDESYAVVWNAWFIKYSFLNRLSLRHTDLLAFPFGIELYNKGQFFGYIFFSINYALSVLTAPVLTYNIQVLANSFLNIVCMFILVRHIVGDRRAAFFSAVIFGFCPYAFVRSWQHLGETYLWPMALFLYYLFRLKEEDSFRVKMLFFMSVILTTINFNVFYYFLVILGVFFIYGYFTKLWKVDRIYLKKIFAMIVFASIVLIIQFYPVLSNMVSPSKDAPSGYNIYHRPFRDLFTQSARPLSYLLPAVVHPVFGKFTDQFIGSPLYGVSYTEHTLYLGWLPIILSFIAFKNWRKKRKTLSVIARPAKSRAKRGEGPKQSPYGEASHSQKRDCGACSEPVTEIASVAPSGLPRNDGRGISLRPPRNDELQVANHDNFYIGFFIWLAIAAWLFSQPPYFTFPYFKIYMPSFVMYKIFPMFRAYCRFGIVVMLAVSVLAGFGSKFLLERFKSYRTKIIVIFLLCGLVLFEFLNFPPFKVIDLTKYPAVYDWLKGQKGDFAIAEYPLDTEGSNEYYKFCQTIHQKKIINGTRQGTYANRVARAMPKLSDEKTAPILSWMKVKYVLVHLGGYEASNDIETVNEFELIKSRALHGLKFIQNFEDVDIYEVRAGPKEPQIDNE